MGSSGRTQALRSLIFTSIRRTRLLAEMLLQLLWILSVTPGTDRLDAPVSLSRKDNKRQNEKKDVWLLCPWVMSYPDFVYRALLFMDVCFVCMESL